MVYQRDGCGKDEQEDPHRVVKKAIIVVNLISEVLMTHLHDDAMMMRLFFISARA